MISYVLLLLLSGCCLKKNPIAVIESPCIDGAHANIDKAGCILYDWGTNVTGEILKIRCTHSLKESWWTNVSFYTVPNGHKIVNKNWQLFCEDRHVRMFVVPPSRTRKKDAKIKIR